MRAVVLLLVVAACTDSRPAVNGRYIDRFYTRDGTIDKPTDLAGLSFDLYVDGTLYAQTEGTFDGTIYIADVPEGPYVLKTSRGTGLPLWEQREAHDFVLVSPRVGRPNAVPATSTPLRLQLDGLAPWGADDFLVADCFENGTEHYPITLDAPLAAGATRVDASFDWAQADWGPYLLDADAGDRLTISRYAMDPRTDLSINKLTQVATGPAPSQTDGTPTDFTASFANVALTSSLTVHVDLDALAAIVSPTLDNWGVGLLKGPASRVFTRFGPDLLGIGSLSPPTSGQITVTEIYGDPFDAAWPTLLTAGYGRTELKPLPDGMSYFSRVYAYDQRLLDGRDYVLEVQEPAASGTLNSYPLAGDIPWDGVSPITLHIDVPAGRVGFYVTLNVVEGGNRAFINSDTNKITLPSEAVRMGADYVLDVGVGTETETSSSGVFSTLGPFRLVRP